MGAIGQGRDDAFCIELIGLFIAWGDFGLGGFWLGGILTGGISSGGILARGILSGGILSGGFCPGDFVRGDFFRGDFVLSPSLSSSEIIMVSNLESLCRTLFYHIRDQLRMM